MKTFKFRTILKRPEGVGTWHYVDTPIRAEIEFGIKGKIPIRGKIENSPFASNLIPRGNGEHYIVLDKKIRELVGIEVGDEVTLEIWQDRSTRTIAVPADFQAVLSGKPEASVFFQNLAYSYKKAYVDWIDGAKKETTRANRIAKALTLLADKKKLR